MVVFGALVLVKADEKGRTICTEGKPYPKPLVHC